MRRAWAVEACSRARVRARARVRRGSACCVHDVARDGRGWRLRAASGWLGGVGKHQGLSAWYARGLGALRPTT